MFHVKHDPELEIAIAAEWKLIIAERIGRVVYERASDEKIKMRARAYANVYKRRGWLTQQPCACGSPDTEMHHHDYSKPLDVVWMCLPCHRAHHRNAE
jgi:hypothetical protein